MPGLPLHELAVQALVARLEEISIGNGYSFDATVKRPRYADEEISFAPGLLIVREEGPTRQDGAVRQAGLETISHRVMVTVFAIAAQDASEAYQTTISRMHNDVIRAVAPSERLGGAVILHALNWTGNDGPESVEIEGAAFTMNFELIVQVRRDDHSIGN